jgi:hypothetical protein
MKIGRTAACGLLIAISTVPAACTEYGGLVPELRPLVECLPPEEHDPECAKYRPPEPSESPDPYAKRNRMTSRRP